ncbi:hypothetical protein, partial [Pseudomonas asiatica]
MAFEQHRFVCEYGSRRLKLRCAEGGAHLMGLRSYGLQGSPGFHTASWRFTKAVPVISDSCLMGFDAKIWLPHPREPDMTS